jgi:hypothetical protein
MIHTIHELSVVINMIHTIHELSVVINQYCGKRKAGRRLSCRASATRLCEVAQGGSLTAARHITPSNTWITTNTLSESSRRDSPYALSRFGCEVRLCRSVCPVCPACVPAPTGVFEPVSHVKFSLLFPAPKLLQVKRSSSMSSILTLITRTSRGPTLTTSTQ